MVILVFLVVIPEQNDDDKKHLNELTSGVEVYYFALLICFIVAATGFAV